MKKAVSKILQCDWFSLFDYKLVNVGLVFETSSSHGVRVYGCMGVEKGLFDSVYGC